MAVASVMKFGCSSTWGKASEDSTLSANQLLTLCIIHLYPQVVCGSKYLVRGESARDHVDLLASSRHWPPIYVVDMATPVALCADLCYPELTNQMWGRNQGCFSSPTEPPVVSFLLRTGNKSCKPSMSTLGFFRRAFWELSPASFFSLSILSCCSGSRIYSTNFY